jgi:hypothetical protein
MKLNTFFMLIVNKKVLSKNVDESWKTLTPRVDGVVHTATNQKVFSFIGQVKLIRSLKQLQ